MAQHSGPTPAVMLIAARLAKIHMAFTVYAYAHGTAMITCQNQATLDAAIEQQRNQDRAKGCGKELASGQWFSFCGNSDMGQTAPALCTECGGEYILNRP